jgi:hypothetical protein
VLDSRAACLVQISGWSAKGKLGQCELCCCLQAFSSLPDGGYTLSVQAQDGAGNTNGTPLTRSWTVTAPLGSYAQITVTPPTSCQKAP